MSRDLFEPLCDATFRARLLRQGLANDEMAQYVDLVESERRWAAGELARMRAALEQLHRRFGHREFCDCCTCIDVRAALEASSQ